MAIFKSLVAIIFFLFSASVSVAQQQSVANTVTGSFTVRPGHLPWNEWKENHNVVSQNRFLSSLEREDGKKLVFTALRAGTVLTFVYSYESTSNTQRRKVSVAGTDSSLDMVQMMAYVRSVEKENAALIAERARLLREARAQEARVAEIEWRLENTTTRIATQMRELIERNATLEQENQKLLIAQRRNE